jgi:UDP:flavonoid glycosyltransferase YjiC (YdhE family)
LSSAGFEDATELQTLTKCWDAIFDSVKPDLIVFDHAPTALHAARGRNVKRVVIGNGFCCPADGSPLPDLRPWLPPDRARLLQDEQRVLENMNRVLEGRGALPLERVSQLYADVDDSFLTTLLEFDHYPGRIGARYRGPWMLPGGAAPDWPPGNGRRVYAYLTTRFPALGRLLARLADIGNPTIVCVNEEDAGLARQFTQSNLRFQSALDTRQVAEECDLAITSGNNTTTIAMLLAGKPVLQIPVYLEQAITAQAVVRLGAGLLCPGDRADLIASRLDIMLNNGRFADAARRFAAKYAGFHPEEEIKAAARRIEELL